MRAPEALAQAERLCVERGTRLTELRRRVLEIIWYSQTPIGAYAILDVLREDGRRGAPPTVYRALDFLQEQGLVHRLASLNAFVGCCHPAHSHGSQFLICSSCGRVSEMHGSRVELTIRDEATSCGFLVHFQRLEVVGVCTDCRANE
jgi:Fur family zinc uptake transcriptional regulator